MKICICDDDKNIADNVERRLREELKGTAYEDASVAVFYDGQDMMREEAFEEYDIIFMDIEMPESDGIKIGKYFRDKNPRIIIAYISAYERYVFDTFEVSPAAFIRKAKFDRDFPRAVSLVIKKYEDINCKIVLKTKGGEKEFFAADISYFEAKFHKVLAFFPDGSNIEISATLEELETELFTKGFIRTHKSFLVNYRQIERLERNIAVLYGRCENPLVSKRKYSESNSRLFTLLAARR